MDLGPRIRDRQFQDLDDQLIDNTHQGGRMAKSEDNANGGRVKRARVGAQLSQSDIARRAGVAQDVEGADESARGEPLLSTLERLVPATRRRLVLDAALSIDDKPGTPNTPIDRRLRQDRHRTVTSAVRHGASNPRATWRIYSSTANAAFNSRNTSCACSARVFVPGEVVHRSNAL